MNDLSITPAWAASASHVPDLKKLPVAPESSQSTKTALSRWMLPNRTPC